LLNSFLLGNWQIYIFLFWLWDYFFSLCAFYWVFYLLWERLKKCNVLLLNQMVPKKTWQEWKATGLLDSLVLLGEQIKDGFSFPVPKIGPIKNLYWVGMGGSGLSCWLIDSFWQEKLKRPIFVYQQPKVAKFISKKDLVVVSSYSGNTAETISFYQQAIKKKINLLGIVGGGQLEEELRKNNTPFLKINSCLNPCGQPRMGVGFGLGFLAKIIFQLRLIDKQTKKEFKKELNSFDFKKLLKFKTKILKKTAKVLKNRLTVLFASHQLEGLAHFYQNQINENAKQMASFFVFPELNHHLLEGLSKLGRNRERLGVVLLATGKESKEEKTRIRLTEEWLKNQQIPNVTVTLIGKTLIEKLFWGIGFGEKLSLVLAYFNQVDPLKIPQVEWFKKKLS